LVPLHCIARIQKFGCAVKINPFPLWRLRMKKTLIALATLAAAAGVHAQSSVTIYGLMDAGVVQANKTGATEGGVAGDSITKFQTGIGNTSRLGFKGTEDLGGGLKANFNLEQGVSVQNGTTGGFTRAANLGLEGSFGKVTMGRVSNPLYEAYNVGDINGGKNMGSGTIYFNGAAAAYTGTNFLSQTVVYDSPNFNGVFGRAYYGFGNVAGDAAKSRTMGGVLAYATGPLVAGVAYQEMNDATASDAGKMKVTAGVGSYSFGALTVKGGYVWAKNSPSTSKHEIAMLGAGYAVTPALGLTAGYYNLRDKNATANKNDMFSLAANYALSKRTTAYAIVTNSKNKGALGIAGYGGGAVAAQAGETQTAFAVGLRHTF
jgi:predicted porin